MPRHAMEPSPAAARPSAPARPRGMRALAVVAGALVVLLGVGSALYVVASRQDGGVDGRAAAGAGQDVLPDCESTESVRVSVVSDVQILVRQLIDGMRADFEDDCVSVRVIDAGPAEVVATAAAGTAVSDVWVADSSLWVSRAEAAGVAVQPAGSLGSSPVVLATSVAAADAQNWLAEPPAWPAVLTSGRPLAVPDPREHAPTMLAIATARAAVGDVATARQLTAGIALAQQRGVADSSKRGLSSIDPADPAAPMVVIGSSDLVRSTGGGASAYARVTPTGGFPVLDYPVVRMGTSRGGAAAAAVDAVVAGLLSPEGRAAAASFGLDPALPADGAGAIATLAAEDLAGLDNDLTILAKPSQILVVVDVSTSMTAEVAPGVTRADVATQALGNALPLLPDPTRVGLWLFASRLEGEQDWTVVAPPQALSARAGEVSQREALAAGVQSLPSRLTPGGTSLYDVSLAALLSAQEAWNPETVSTVVIITDGVNEDSTGLTLEQLNAEITARTDPARPVGLINVAFGPESDLDALTQIAGAASAWGPSQAIDARDPTALQSLLVATLSARIEAAAAATAAPAP